MPSDRIGMEADVEWDEFRETVKSIYLESKLKKDFKTKRRSDDFELSSEVIIPESLTDFIAHENELLMRR